MSIKSDRWIRQQCTPPALFHSDVSEEEQRFILGEHLEEVQTRFKNDRHDSFVPMISPFEPSNIRTKQVYDQAASRDMDTDVMVDQKILSYGTSSFGYDVTLQDEFRIFTNINSTIIDPLNFDEKCLVEFKGDVCIIPPNSYILGVTREYFKIPRDVMVVCLGKSTYARCGAIVNVTPIEPGFCGHVVIEISNSTSLPLKVYANQGIAQFMFFQSDEECETSYADKAGKYQGQTGLTLAKG